MEHEKVYEIVFEDENGIVLCMDEPGAGGACHRYEIRVKSDDPELKPTKVKFQEGPVTEVGGWNGPQNEHLIQIVLHRLRGFQKGKFPCRPNAIAITKLEEALHRLNDRTAERKERGVEGKSEM